MVEKTIIAVVVVIVAVIVVVAAAALLTGKPAASSTTTAAQAITLPSNQNVSVTTSINPKSLPTQVGANASAYFITPAEAANIIGPGNSTAYEATTAAQLSSVVPPELANYSITGEYTIMYNSTSGNVYRAINQLALATSQPKPLYGIVLSQYNDYFNDTFLTSQGATNITDAVNSTIDGMTYSYSTITLAVPGTNDTGTQTVMFGYKNSSIGFLQITQINTTQMLNETSIAAVLAGHLS